MYIHELFDELRHNVCELSDFIPRYYSILETTCFYKLSLHIAQLCAYYLIADTDRFDFIELVDFDYEGNLPSFYSALALLFSSALLSLIARHKKQIQCSYYGHWVFLSLIFMWLSLDEALGLHEEFGDFIESLSLFEASGFLYFAWIVPYGILLTIFILSYLKFLMSLPKATSVLFIYAGSIFVFGAIGLESFSAKEADLNGSTTIKYSALYTLEEFCEMTGVVIFIHALLQYIEKELGEIRLSFK